MSDSDKTVVGLTLFCDASHHPSLKVAGWGAWAKRDGWKAGKLMGGPLKVKPANSSEAEVCAIANAFTTLSREGHFEGVQIVMVQSDSLRALMVIRTMLSDVTISNHIQAADIPEGKIAKVTELEALACEVVGKVKETHGLQLIARHVRGHLKGGGRQWVNSTCDAIARKHMKSLAGPPVISKGKKRGKRKPAGVRPAKKVEQADQ